MKPQKSKRDILFVFIVSVIAIGILPFGLHLARQRRQAEAWESFNYGPDRKGSAKAANLRILARGAGDNGKPMNQWTEVKNAYLLIAATLYNDPATVQAIINKGINVNGKMEHGITALHAAVVFRRSDMVKLLLQNGADTRAEVEGLTALDYMARPPHNYVRVGSDQQILQLLKQAEAKRIAATKP